VVSQKTGRGQLLWPRKLRYTLTIVKRTLIALVVLLAAARLSLGEETSFRSVKLPNPNGKQIKAILTFSDKDKAVEVRPTKGNAVSIPYAEIDKCSYEYTVWGMGKDHWLEIAYHHEDARKTLVLHMEEHDYLKILDALKAHTGIDAEVLGNAEKRR